MKVGDVMRSTGNSQVYKRARKLYLALQGRIQCGYCGYHCVENATRKPYHRSWKRLRRQQYRIKHRHYRYR